MFIIQCVNTTQHLSVAIVKSSYQKSSEVHSLF